MTRLPKRHRYHARVAVDVQNKRVGVRVHRHNDEPTLSSPRSEGGAAERRLCPLRTALPETGLPALATSTILGPLALILDILRRVGGPFLRGLRRICDLAYRVERGGEGVEPSGLFGLGLLPGPLFANLQEHLLGIAGV